MYQISDFSKITSLTVKALRYYDEENIQNNIDQEHDQKNKPKEQTKLY